MRSKESERIGHRYVRRHALAVLFSVVLPVALPSSSSGNDLQNGDLLVAALESLGFFGNGPGIIWRVRGGEVQKFCESPPQTTGDNHYWSRSEQLLVDSGGRVVFFGWMGSIFFSGLGWGLFQCDAMGNPPTLLARFPNSPEDNPNFFYPFPGEGFSAISGLHLARAAGITIDDDQNSGNPSISLGDDAYVFALGHVDAQGLLSVRTVRYVPALDEWQQGPPAVTWSYRRDPPPNDRPPAMPDMVSGGGATYSATCNAIAKHSEPLRIDAAGSIGGLDFSLQVSLFGGFDVTPPGITLDDVTDPNVQGCDPRDCPPPFNMMPGPGLFAGLSGLGHLAHDGFVNVTSEFGGSAGIGRIEDLDAVFQGDDETFWCNPAASCGIFFRKILFSPVVPLVDPKTGSINGVEHLLSARGHGLVGTQWQSGRVLRVSGDRMVEVVSGLVDPRGLGGYPPDVGLSGFVIAIRMDASSGETVVTDPNGKRLGLDLTTLQPVNDLGIDGADSGPGDVRVWVIKNATPGPYCLETQSAGGSDYAINVYSSGGSKPVGMRVRRTASTGSTKSFRFRLSSDGTIAWEALPRESDLDGDTDVDLTDFALQLACTAGPAQAYEVGNLPPGCKLSPDADGVLPSDQDRNGLVDLKDFATLQHSFGGAGESVPVQCP